MIKINFNKLLKDYDSDLVTKLRGFNDQYDYLQYWVPGSDKTRSLVNLIDAMHESNTFDFLIIILKEDKYLVNEIKKNCKGIIQIKTEESGFEYKIFIQLDKQKYQSYKTDKIIKKNFDKKNFVVVNELKEKRENYNILTCYEKNLQNHKLRWNKKKNIITEDIFFEFIDTAHKLFIKINSKTKKVVECSHDFKEKNTQSIIVDKFCDAIFNKHIQEAKEHGIIYLEHLIRPAEIKKEIKGIILPKKVGGFFLDLQQCVNKIYIKIKKHYNFEDIINKEYSLLSKDWLNISHDKKIEKLKKILSNQIIPLLKLKKSDVIVDGIEFDTRIVVKLSSEFMEKNFWEKNYLIMIEDLFKKLVDNRLELFTIEKKDANVLRHINSPRKI